MDPVLKCWVGPIVLTLSALVQWLTSVKAETYIYIVVVALFFMFMMYSYFAIISKLNMTKFYMQEWVGFPRWNECMQLDGKGLTQLIKMVDAFPAQTRRQHLFGVLHPWVYFLHGGDGTPYYSCSPCYIWLPPAWMKTITKSIESKFTANQMHQCQGYHQQFILVILVHTQLICTESVVGLSENTSAT